MDDLVPQFTHVIEQLRTFKLSYLHLVDPRQAEIANRIASDSTDFALKAWGTESPVILAGGFEADSAKAEVEKQNQDVAIAFGRHFIGTPDLVFRLQKELELNKYDRSTFYLPKSPVGYIDYPFSEEFENEQSKL